MLQKFQSSVVRFKDHIKPTSLCTLSNHSSFRIYQIIIIADYFNKYTTMHPVIVIMMMWFSNYHYFRLLLGEVLFYEVCHKMAVWMQAYIFYSLKLCLTPGVVCYTTLQITHHLALRREVLMGTAFYTSYMCLTIFTRKFIPFILPIHCLTSSPLVKIKTCHS